MKKLVTMAFAAIMALFVMSCGGGSSDTATVDSLETGPSLDSAKPTDTVYPKTDTNSYKKEPAAKDTTKK